MLTVWLFLALNQPLPSAVQPKPVADGVKSRLPAELRRAGYQSIPLRRFRGQLMLDTTYAGKPLALMVDTGAAFSCLDLDTAPVKYGLKVFGQGLKMARVGGQQPAASTSLPGLTLRGVECPPTPWLLTDLSAGLEFGKRNDNLGGDALLGMDLLDYLSAWVDTRTATLWVLDPVQVATDLHGEWQATLVEHRSKPFDTEYIASYSLSISGIDVTYRADGTVRPGNLKLDPWSSPKSLDIVSAEGGVFPGIYRVTGDELKYSAGLLRPDDNTQRPSDFDPRTNRATVVPYKRVKPATPKK